MVTAAGSHQPFNIHRGMGLVAQVFQEKDLQQLSVGTRAIGHVRYSTSGSSTLKNAQPLVVDCARGQLAIAHNGNLINAAVLREDFDLAVSDGDLKEMLRIVEQRGARGAPHPFFA